ncbi:MAG: hypothetical protein EPN34_00405 [Burkholderiaceae bacterium]|nr:MAG: hypothetical protein EPN34_00405 [Burkholderiaceae bacterium]
MPNALSPHARAHWVTRLRDHLQQSCTEPVELVQTHLSWLLLAGATAYKIKRPVVLPFVDFSSLAERRRCCEEEVRLNRRFAPQLYLGVSRITGTSDAPRLDGDGEAFDYAVRMRRFASGSLLAERATAGTLLAADVDRLAERIAAIHLAAPRAAPDSGFGTPERRAAAPLSVLDALRLAAPSCADAYTAMRRWLKREAAALAPLWHARMAAGFVREGHGDLHLANLVLLDGDILPFDAIEFDPALRWIDIVDDAAFTAMDLIAHERSGFAVRFINGWLDATGDHAGLALWRHALVYRALVRALAAALQPRAGPDYLAVARHLAAALRAPRLIVMHGLPASGKSVVALRIAEAIGAIRLRSDVERKRLLGLPALADTHAAAADAYSAGATQRTYARLAELARTTLEAGWPAIVDAAFLRRTERARFAELAEELGVPFAIVACHAPEALLRERIAARRLRRDDPSEADIDVLRRLTAAAEPLDAAERAAALDVDTAAPEAAQSMALARMVAYKAL